MFNVQITKDKATINRIIDLRYEVLRNPWGKPKETATDELEESSINVYIEDKIEIVACGRLQKNGSGLGQIRFMAVHPDYRGKGLGKLIVAKLEAEALNNKMNTIELQARDNALEFYKSCGYVIKEKSFILWDIIQHYLMVKELK
jgi:predicted GNAT family acetyltransferase